MKQLIASDKQTNESVCYIKTEKVNLPDLICFVKEDINKFDIPSGI